MSAQARHPALMHPLGCDPLAGIYRTKPPPAQEQKQLPRAHTSQMPLRLLASPRRWNWAQRTAWEISKMQPEEGMENLKFSVTDGWKTLPLEACREHQTKQLGDGGVGGEVPPGPTHGCLVTPPPTTLSLWVNLLEHNIDPSTHLVKYEKIHHLLLTSQVTLSL